LTTPRSRHTATLLPNGKVLVVGGESGGQALASGEIYDPATNSWSGAAGLMTGVSGTPRRSSRTGRLVVGGLDLGGFFVGGNILASAELYDPATNTWSSAASLTTARHGPTATLLASGVVLIVGGMAGSGTILASGELYTAATTPPVEVIEYFHAEFRHYFITASTDEITKLDNGTFTGWARTNQSFNIGTAGGAGRVPVCRFFTVAFPPTSSHFYAPRGLGCEDTLGNADWQFEAFLCRLPDAAGAPAELRAGLSPIQQRPGRRTQSSLHHQPPDSGGYACGRLPRGRGRMG
jgi:hypothetical protein